MKKTLLLVLLFLLFAVSAFFLGSRPAKSPDKTATSTEEEIVWEMEDKTHVIRNINVQPGDFIESPLVVTGEARGTWYFEASFPITLVNWDGLIIAETIATAQTDWMSEEFVPFAATIVFTKPDYGERGAIIFRKDNPSGLSQFDDSLQIDIRFK